MAEVRSATARPRLASSFINRVQELDLCRRLLSQHPLVTLVGTGGVGKTRLARQVISDLGEVAVQVYWVDFAAVRVAESVPAVLAESVGVAERPGVGLLIAIIEQLQKVPTMLVVDNCEHIIDAAAELVSEVLAAAPQVVILATSREALAVPGEVIVDIEPLAVPLPGAPWQSFSEFPAVELFLDRARLVRPDLTVSADNAESVRAVCAGLDGLPLALELAASGTRALSLADLSKRVSHGQALLRGSREVVPGRHRSLDAALEWSHALLTEQQRRLFRRLAIFAGGFTTAAAQQVCGWTRLTDAEAVLLVGELVERSLVVARHGAAGRTRYQLLETTRRYATKKLAEAGELPETQRRHGQWVRQLLGSTLGSAEQSEALEPETGNIRAAIHTALDLSDPNCLADATAAAKLWRSLGLLDEAQVWIERALEELPDADDRTQAEAHLAAARLAAVQGAPRRVVEHAEAAIQCAVRLADLPLQATAQLTLAGAQRNQLLLDEALACATTALATFESVGDDPGASRAHVELAFDHLFAGRSQAAIQHAELALRAADGQARWQAHGGRAVALLNEQLPGSVSAATQAWEAAEIARDVYGIAWCLGVLAEAMTSEHLPGARTYLTRSLELALRHDFGYVLGNGIASASVIVADTDPRLGARLFGAALNILNEGCEPDDTIAYSYHRALAALRQRVGARFDIEFASGRTMGRTEAAEQALRVLRERDPIPPTPAGPSSPISARESEILRLVAQGMTDQQIASSLFISIRTVRSHLDRIRDKTEMRRRADLTRLATELGLTTPAHPKGPVRDDHTE